MELDEHSIAASANGRPARGPVYVAVRVSERAKLASPSVTRECARCEQQVLVESDAVGLADSCVAIVCSTCTATPDGILYIPSSASG